jgi:hypothetical protein
MILQYRYNKTNDTADAVYHGNMKFVQCEHVDKLAFGIIPRNDKVGSSETDYCPMLNIEPFLTR